MKNFLLAFLFGLFSVMCFAKQSEFKKDKIEKQESKFLIQDINSNEFVNVLNLKLNLDFDVVDNSVLFFKETNHLYFYKENLNKNMYSSFSNKILNINKTKETGLI